MSVRLMVALLLVVLAPGGIALAACGTSEGWIWDCTNPRNADIGHDGMPNPCPRANDADAGSDASEGCAVGECIKTPSAWHGPLWAWISSSEGSLDSEGAPDCPPGTSDREGYTDLVHPDKCEPCTCEPSRGSCELSSKLTVGTGICAAGTPTIPFDAPPGWDGTCDATTQVPAGIAKSLTIAPLTVAQESCAVGVGHKPPALRVVTPHWQTFARTCVGTGWTACGGPNFQCIDKTKAPFPEARLCVVDLGDSLDPCHDEWPDRHVIHKVDIDDERECTECTCGPPMGSMCTAQVYAYTDTACGVPVDPGYTVSSAGPKCVDIMPPGQPMASKSATPPTYIPGTCESIPGSFIPDGGALTVTPTFTLCCKP
jgi:hypothetical protein